MKLLMSMVILIAVAVGALAVKKPEACTDIAVANCIKRIAIDGTKQKTIEKNCMDASDAQMCLTGIKDYCPEDMVITFNTYWAVVTEIEKIYCRGPKMVSNLDVCSTALIGECLKSRPMIILKENPTKQNCDDGKNSLQCLKKLESRCSGSTMYALIRYSKRINKLMNKNCSQTTQSTNNTKPTMT